MATTNTQDSESPSQNAAPPVTSVALTPNPRAKDTGNIEEGRDAYNPGKFHPVCIEDVHAEKYKMLSKIGYGLYSTKEDDDRFRALKALSAECYSAGTPIFEREILTHLRDSEGARKLMGYQTFAVSSRISSTHVCLSSRLWDAWFKDSMIPYPIMRCFIINLYWLLISHMNRMLSTQPANIFVKFQDISLIESGYLAKAPILQQNRAEKRYTPIQSLPLRSYYFSEADQRHLDEFDIALGDWGVSSWADRHLSECIQVHY
ncbi:hypothetical protein B0T25DRAFT_584017 [Lasiosphaeria hispida]|uniref:Uncharacterized protein n=1 Tax=Lasiosphaeria hispida TaxID=260671 RepID=A0AAJ0HCW5_9PEZI|nr:hypothetical protein B0T25DRAFT_584017 [Lasiosphaeria hispida]